VAGVRIYETPVLPEWIDYNGHLRDAYYVVILSAAIDALMDRIGLDAAYRQRTGCTLYSVELHVHYLREVKRTDTVEVSTRILGADHKRIHAAFELNRSGSAAPAAAAEVVLLHVQQGATVATTPFPGEIAAALGELQAAGAALPADAPGSRRLELRPSGRTP
jgi:acyl-CoA thioester hydrolase